MNEEQETTALKHLAEGCTRKDSLILAGLPIKQHKEVLQGEFLEKVQKIQAAFRRSLVVEMVATAKSGGNTSGALKLLGILDPYSWADVGVIKRTGEDFQPGGPLAEALKPAEDEDEGAA